MVTNKKYFDRFFTYQTILIHNAAAGVTTSLKYGILHAIIFITNKQLLILILLEK